jgi:hypothetical protein
MADSHDNPQMHHPAEPVAGHEIQAPAVHATEAAGHAQTPHDGAHEVVMTEAHGEGHPETEESDVSAKYIGPHEVPNAATLIESWWLKPGLHHGARPHPAEYIKINGHEVIPINPLFRFCMRWRRVLRAQGFPQRQHRKPGRLQNFFEMFLAGFGISSSACSAKKTKNTSVRRQPLAFHLCQQYCGLIPVLNPRPVRSKRPLRWAS